MAKDDALGQRLAAISVVLICGPVPNFPGTDFVFLVLTFGVGASWGKMGTVNDYQRYAARCLQEARAAPDSSQRSFVIEMAQAWRRLAEYAITANVGQPDILEPDRGD